MQYYVASHMKKNKKPLANVQQVTVEIKVVTLSSVLGWPFSMDTKTKECMSGDHWPRISTNIPKCF